MGDGKMNLQRRWWVRLGALSLGVVVIGVVGVRVWWGWVADRRLAEVVEEARQRGEPLRQEELPREAVADEENAAFFIARAEKAIRMTEAQTEQYASSFRWNPRWGQRAMSAKEVELVRQLRAANTQVFTDVRRARQCTKADWSGLEPKHAPTGALAEFLRLMAFYEHTIGNEAEAIELSLDVLRVARAEGEANAAYAHAVAAGLRRDVLIDLNRIGSDLLIEWGKATTRPGVPATHKQILAVMAELLDEEPMRGAMQRELLAVQAELFEWLRAQEAANRLLAPAYRIGFAKAMRQWWADADVVGQPCWRLAEQRLHLMRPQPWHDDISWMSRVMLEFEPHPGWPHFIPARYEDIMLSRMSAVSLAIVLYRVDHGNRWPVALNELAPQYLPAVPLDPYSADGQPLKYTTKGRPRLYSVGANGRDDGGSDLATGGGVAQFGQPADDSLKGVDSVMYLVAMPLSANAVDDDAKEADDPADEQQRADDKQKVPGRP